ncbi:cyanoexosortase A system-associated protein [Leptolyngbya sp. AN02str]|uniref:cyanoexosortase A system-associated protein n=1 Tax=Leptolyngbya sp. AN02str TaxID=3423363 RepID=UPI003D3233FF
MTEENPIRLAFLASIFGGTVLVCSQLLFRPGLAQEKKLPEVFNQTVELKGWKQVHEEILANSAEPDEAELIGGKSYRYQNDENNVEVEMRYLIQMDSSVRNLLLKYGKGAPEINFNSTIQQNEDGYYSIFFRDEAMHLSSCINPRGGSTVTSSQFVHNRYIYDFRPERILPVLVGQQTVQDSRCLWTYMKMPTQQESLKDAAQQLEEFWKLWLQWWQPNFPTL